MNRQSLLGGLLLAVLGIGVAWQLLRERDEASPERTRAPRVLQQAAGPATATHGSTSSDLPAVSAPAPAPLADAAPDSDVAVAPEDTSPVTALGTVGEAVQITARIVDARGEPLAGARVAWLPTDETLQAAGLIPMPADSGTQASKQRRDQSRPLLARLPQMLTGPDGRVAFDTRHIAYVPTADDVFGIPVAAEPALLVTLDGWATRTFPVTKLKAGPRDLGDIALEAQAVVTGRAVDEEGRPLMDTRVLVTSQTVKPKELKESFWQFHFVPELMEQRTTEDGHFTLNGLWQGKTTLRLVAPGRIERELNCTPAGGGTLDIGDVILERGASIAGRVLDAAGAPIAGAKVSVVDGEIHGGSMGDVGYGYDEGDDSIHDELSQAEDNARHASVLTDAGGAFRVGGLDSPQLSVYATADGFEPGRLRPVAVSSTDLRLVLQPEATLRITVIDHTTRAPLPDATVTVIRDSGVESGTGDVALGLDADGPGAFVAHRAGPRSHRVYASAPGHGNGGRPAPGVQPGQSATIVVELGPQAVLAGRVIDAHGAPVAGATIALLAPGRARYPFLQVPADAAGAFRMERLGPLSAELVAFAAGWPDSRPLSVALGPGELQEALELRLPAPARIHGTVFASDGTPQAGARVDLDVPPFGEFKFMELSDHFVGDAEADEQGRYAFEALAPGEYQLEVRQNGTVTCTLEEGEDRVIDFRAPPGVRVHGRVTSSGTPVEGVSVKAYKDPRGEGGPLGWPKPGITDGDGAYALALAVGGELEIYVDATSGRDSERRIVHANPGDDVIVDFALPGGHIAGRVVDDVSGAAVAGLEIKLIRGGNIQTAYCSSAADGSFRLDWLPADTYRLGLSGRGNDATHAYGPMVVGLEPRDIPLGEGETVDDLVLSVCRGATLEGDVRLAEGGSVKDNERVQLVRLAHGAIVPGKSEASQSNDARGHDWILTERDKPVWADTRTKGGRYRVVALPAGEYRVLAGKATPEEVRDLGQPVIVHEHEVVQLDLVAR